MPKLICTYCPKAIQASNPDVSSIHNGQLVCPSCAVRLVLLNGLAGRER